MKNKERSWRFVLTNVVKLCIKWIDIATIVVLYLWIERELDVMGTPTKVVYSLFKILLSIIRVYLKRELQKSQSVSYSMI